MGMANSAVQIFFPSSKTIRRFNPLFKSCFSPGAISKSIQNPFGLTSNSLYRRRSEPSGCKNASATSRSHNWSLRPFASASPKTVIVRYRARNRRNRISGLHNKRTSVSRAGSAFLPCQSAWNRSGAALSHEAGAVNPSAPQGSVNRTATAFPCFKSSLTLFMP